MARDLKPPAVVAFAIWLAHASYRVAFGDPQNLLWNCNVGILAAGPALLARNATLNGIAFAFLVLGNFLWFADMARGGERVATAALTHLGGLVVTGIGVRELGMPRGTWWRSLATIVSLQAICRLVTSPEDNINAAFRVHELWPWPTMPYPVYYAINLGLVSLAYYGAERIGRRIAAT